MKKFDPQIYPRLLVVLDSLKEITLFEKREGGELDKPSKAWNAFTCNAIEKETGRFVILVYFENLDFETIAHESVHIANNIFDDCGIDMGYEHDEHYAYLVGWVAKCIGEALNVKLIKDKRK